MQPRLLPLLLAAALAAPAATQIPGPGGGSTGAGGLAFRVRAASAESHTLHPDDLLPAAGGRIPGVVNTLAVPEAVGVYDKVPGHENGLYRVNLYLFQDIPLSAVADRLRLGRQAGMRTLLTCVGTPGYLSPITGGEPALYGIPEYAKAPPVDNAAWAADLRDRLVLLRDDFGILPDYVEIWNEADLELWWTGDLEQLLSLYEAAALEIRANFPGIKIGGFGAGRMQGRLSDVPLLQALVIRAGDHGLPLDFVSWHHYQLASGLRFYGTVAAVRSAAQANGFPDLELLVSEWNLWGRPEGHPRALELDGSHAAAQLAGVTAAIADLELDGNAFFMLQDPVDWDPEISDLTGSGPGAITRRGIKKPVFRLMELMCLMARQQRVTVDRPEDEWALSVQATRQANRVRVVVGNDVCEPDWIWSEACKERGGAPGRIWDAVEAAKNKGKLTYASLRAQGLETWEVDIAFQVLPLLEEAAALKASPRHVRLDVAGAGSVSLVQAIRFDAGHNAPVAHREDFLPGLDWIETQAQAAGWDAAADFMTLNGITPPPPGTVIDTTSPESVASALGITVDQAVQLIGVYVEAVNRERMAYDGYINQVPAAQVTVESPAAAGVTLAGNTIEFDIQPDAVLILDFDWL